MRLIDDSFLRVRDQQSHAWYLAINGISKHKGLSTVRDASLWIFMSGACKCNTIWLFISSMQIPTWGFLVTQKPLLIICGISSVNLSFLKLLLCQRFPLADYLIWIMWAPFNWLEPTLSAWTPQVLYEQSLADSFKYAHVSKHAETWKIMNIGRKRTISASI